jgi:hypothetical protein
MIIKENRFSVSSKLTIDTESSVSFVGVVGDFDVVFNFEMYEASTAGFDVELIEGCTHTGGSEVTAFAMNRGSEVAHQLELIGGATISGGTTVRLTGSPIPDSPQGRQVTIAPLSESWALKKNTEYAIKVTNLNGASIDILARLGWSEYAVL